MNRFIGELQHRNVLRVVAAYVAVSWLLIQVVETLFPVFGLSDAAIRGVVIMLAIGLVPVMVVAWVFELTPEGLVRDSEVDRGSVAAKTSTERLNRLVMVALALAVGYFAFDKFILAPERTADQVEAARVASRTEGMLDTFGEKSIAVLPFRDMSATGDQSFFADGIAEELIIMLGKLDNLRVISRSSSFALYGNELSIPEIAERLNVNYVLDGSVRRSEGRVRVSTQLIEGSTDTQLWAETYERESNDIFEIQDLISAQVVTELKVRVVDNFPDRQTTTSEAYELFLEAASQLADVGTDKYDGERTIALLNQVIELDESYAPAHAKLAIAYIWSNVAVPDEKIEACAIRALELDATNPDALAALGRVRRAQGRYAEGEELYEKAIEANPNTAYYAYRWLALSYSDSDPARYLSNAQKAYMVNPLDRTIRSHVATALGMFGHVDEALKIARDGFRVDPYDSLPYTQAGQIYETTGHVDLAILSHYRAFRLDFGTGYGDWATAARIPLLLITIGDYDAAEAWLNETIGMFPDAAFFRFQRIAAIFHRGDRERALAMLQEARDQPSQLSPSLLEQSLNLSRDFEWVRSVFESESAERDWINEPFDPNSWRWYLYYATALLHTGNIERAKQLIDENITFLRERASSGIESMDSFSINFWMAALYSMNGDTAEAIRELGIAERRGRLTCTVCLRNLPYFDNLQGNPQFEGMVSRREAKNAAQLQRLRKQGMILTPSELMALEEFDFNPFAD